MSKASSWGCQRVAQSYAVHFAYVHWEASDPQPYNNQGGGTWVRSAHGNQRTQVFLTKVKPSADETIKKNQDMLDSVEMTVFETDT